MTHNLQPGSVISGRFRLDRELGRGGMGTVWEARHLALETQVAIKFLKSELSQRQDIRVRFAREGASVARIRSPHVVGVLDSGFTEEDGYAFIVMELLLGEDLGKKLSRVAACTLEETRSLVLQVARGLAKAHAVGILHRDLKPENLFVCDEDEPIVKILDFGIAKAFGPEAATHKTDTGQLLGTPMYMSPEQALGRALDHRSDLYSLAVVAYRCLAGRAPFDHATPGEMIVAVSMQPPPPPSQFNPALPPVLDAWFAGALAKEPYARSCQSASELAESFERACAEAQAAPLPSAAAPGPAALVSLPPGSTLSNEARSCSAEEVATTVLVPVLQGERPPSKLRLAGGLASALVALVALGIVLLLQRLPAPSPVRPNTAAKALPLPSATTHRETALFREELPTVPSPSAAPAGVPAAESSRSGILSKQAPNGAAKQLPLAAPQPSAVPDVGLASEANVSLAASSASPTPAAPLPNAGNAASPRERAARAETEPAELGIDRTSPW